MRPARARAAVVLAALALTVTACSGIPTTSVPQVISSVNSVRTNTPSPITPPPRDADPRVIVQRFLDAAAQTSDPSHTDARQYLGTTAANGWKDTTATVITQPVIGSGIDAQNQLTVKATELGVIGSDGVYRPLSTPVAQTFVFTLGRNAAGQWRISTLPAAGQSSGVGVSNGVGVLLPEQDIGSYYRPSPLYFLNPAGDTLVPDTRYYAVTDQTLATDLLDQLLAGPQSYLANAVSTEFSDRIVAKRASVALGSTLVVQLPGVAQSDSSTIRRLAAQLAWTLGSIQSAVGHPIRLQDGTKTVPVEGSSTFTMSDFSSFDPAPVEGAPLYFLRPDGSLATETGSSMRSVAPFDVPHVTSVAAASTSSSSTTSGAAVSAAAPGSRPSLRLGTLPGTLRAIPLPASATSRPEWQPRSDDDLWLGVGSVLYRSSSGSALRAIPFSIGVPGVQVLAIRFASDGTRVAMVLSARGTGAVWVGAVDEAADGSARIDGLHQVTPSAWSVKDVAWSEVDGLVAVGTTSGTSDGHVWELRDDGSLQAAQTTIGLPDGAPDAVAAAQGSPVVVSVAGATLWELDPASDSWAPLGNGGTVNGSVPTYRS